MRNPLRDPNNRAIFAAKRKVAALLRAPIFGAAVRKVGRGIVRSKGLRIDTRSPEISDVSRARLFWGIYEGAEMRLLKNHLLPTSTIVDLGASIGVLSAAAARQLGGQVRMICVEANPGLLALAERNVRSNAPLADVTVIHGAVDCETPSGEMVSFRKGAVEHTGSALARGADSSASFSAPAVRLGELLSDCGVTGGYLLLADVEGAEAGLFLNDSASLDACRQMIVEFHDTEFQGIPYSSEQLRKIAESRGFQTVASYGVVSVLNRVA